MTSAERAALEACLEADAAALLAALDASGARRSAPFAGRSRIYWDGAPEDLVPVFRDGERRLELARDGRVERVESWAGSGRRRIVLADVREGPDGVQIVLRVREDPSRLDRFVDDEGRSLRERLGAVVVPAP